MLDMYRSYCGGCAVEYLISDKQHTPSSRPWNCIVRGGLGQQLTMASEVSFSLPIFCLCITTSVPGGIEVYVYKSESR